MQSLDTNIILRLLLNDVPEQAKTVMSLIDKNNTASLVVEDAVLFEAVWILSGPQYAMSRETISRALLRITGIAQVKCNRRLLGKAIPLYIKHPKLSFIDVCLASYAELNNAAPLLTFDKNLSKTLLSARLLTQGARID